MAVVHLEDTVGLDHALVVGGNEDGRLFSTASFLSRAMTFLPFSVSSAAVGSSARIASGGWRRRAMYPLAFAAGQRGGSSEGGAPG